MTDIDTPQSPTADAPPMVVRHVVTATPVPVVILPPAHLLMPVSLPEPLATDLRNLHARIMAGHAEARFRVLDFDQWLIEELKTLVYGHGVDRGELADAGVVR